MNACGQRHAPDYRLRGNFIGYDTSPRKNTFIYSCLLNDTVWGRMYSFHHGFILCIMVWVPNRSKKIWPFRRKSALAGFETDSVPKNGRRISRVRLLVDTCGIFYNQLLNGNRVPVSYIFYNHQLPRQLMVINKA